MTFNRYHLVSCSIKKASRYYLRCNTKIEKVPGSIKKIEKIDPGMV